LFWEAYYYPHGIAFLFTAILQGSMTVQQAIERAFAVRREQSYEVQGEGGATASCSLDDLAHKGLSVARRIAHGPGASPGKGPSHPFTVATVVRGDGVVPNAATPSGGEVHRALEAITRWQPDYAYVELPDLETIRLETRTAPKSHVLYGQPRGRAIWFPASFIPSTEDQHSLACYHRNLVLASLQVESLGGLISGTARCILEQPERLASLQPCARRAAGILGRLYGGSSDTYRSWSPRAQIEQNGLVPDLEAVRARFYMQPLS
jgi:hypothetical protein